MADGDGDGQEEPITPFDAASYAYGMTADLSKMARRAGLHTLASALDHAHALAGEALVATTRKRQPSAGKPAPEDAA